MCWPNIFGSQTSSDLKCFLNLDPRIVTGFCLFLFSVCLCFCFCLTATDRLTEGVGWDGGWSFHQHSVYGGARTLWPSCELSGGLRRPPERPEVSIHAHHKQCTALPTAQREDSHQRLLTWASMYCAKHAAILWFFIILSSFFAFPSKRNSFTVYTVCVIQKT